MPAGRSARPRAVGQVLLELGVTELVGRTLLPQYLPVVERVEEADEPPRHPVPEREPEVRGDVRWPRRVEARHDDARCRRRQRRAVWWWILGFVAVVLAGVASFAQLRLVVARTPKGE
jgi:hypothetical protein